MCHYCKCQFMVVLAVISMVVVSRFYVSTSHFYLGT